MDKKSPAPSPRIVRGRSPGESNPPWGWLSHVLFTSTAFEVWRDPRGKIWPSGSSRGLVIPTDCNWSCWAWNVVPPVSGACSDCRALVFISCSSFLQGKYSETTPRRACGGFSSQCCTKLPARCQPSPQIPYLSFSLWTPLCLLPAMLIHCNAVWQDSHRKLTLRLPSQKTPNVKSRLQRNARSQLTVREWGGREESFVTVLLQIHTSHCTWFLPSLS